MDERRDPPTAGRDGRTGAAGDGTADTVLSDGGVRTGGVDAGGPPAGTASGVDAVDEGAPEDVATVLHVDDDPAFGRLVREFVERTDRAVRVVTETDARTALERVGVGDVDCVVTDVEMPGMDGLELARAVGARNPGLPVVLFTSRTWAEVGDETVAATVEDHVQKAGGPDQLEALAETVHGTLD